MWSLKFCGMKCPFKGRWFWRWTCRRFIRLVCLMLFVLSGQQFVIHFCRECHLGPLEWNTYIFIDLGKRVDCKFHSPGAPKCLQWFNQKDFNGTKQYGYWVEYRSTHVPHIHVMYMYKITEANSVLSSTIPRNLIYRTVHTNILIPVLIPTTLEESSLMLVSRMWWIHSTSFQLINLLRIHIYFPTAVYLVLVMVNVSIDS